MLAYGQQVWDREKVVLIPDHYIFTADERANRNVDILREFALEQDIKYFYDIKDRSNFRANPDYKGVCHVALAQEGHCRPGEVLFGTDSHTCNAGAFGQFATGIGNTDAGFIMGTGQLLIKVFLCWPLAPPIHLRSVKWNLEISVVYFSSLFQKSQ